LKITTTIKTPIEALATINKDSLQAVDESISCLF